LAPPLFILGVRRSGTTLLRVMLDRSSQLAVPDESYFIPQLANRHGGRLDLPAFLDDLRRIGTLRDWGVPVEAVRERLADGGTLSEGIAAVYETFAEQQGKPRWGDKTPMYMQHLGLLERLFPHALYLHLIRDGRDAAVSFLAMPPGIVTETWAHPRGAAGFAAQWRTEVRAARRLGRRLEADRYLEVRYEDLVRDPESELRRIGDFAGIPFENAMLEYQGSVDLSAKPHQQSLAKAPTPGLRDWRTELSREDLAAFEGIAGDLLTELGYEVATPHGRAAPGIGARARLASYAARVNAWRTAGLLVRKSPLWRRRHPALS
jgi:sulfotransferase family protein